MKRPPIAGAVLAGGKSSRMGRDKSLLRLKGRTLTALAAAKLLKAGYAPVFVVGPRKLYGLPKGVAVVPDRHPGLGPLAGLEAALIHAAGLPCLLTPCDMPLLSLALLRRLRRAHRPPKPITACRRARGPQPLPGIYSPGLLPLIRRRIRARKLALYPLLKKARLLPASERSLANLNHPAALKTVLH